MLKNANLQHKRGIDESQLHTTVGLLRCVAEHSYVLRVNNWAKDFDTKLWSYSGKNGKHG